MKIVSFNVNSVRARLPHLAKLVEAHAPDIVGLQETKVADEEFPDGALSALGYYTEFYGQKTHYGVAVMSRTEAAQCGKGLPREPEHADRRFIACEFLLSDGRALHVLNGYFPQGEARSHPVKFPAKERFYKGLREHLGENYRPDDLLIVMGDMNVAPDDLDIGIGDDSRKRWLKDGKCSFLPEEREWLAALTDWGLEDTYRLIRPDAEDLYSWFDYRSKGFERDPKRGLRIDLILATNPLAELCRDAGIDYGIRGLERPSDHCPVWAEFDLTLA